MAFAISFFQRKMKKEGKLQENYVVIKELVRTGTIDDYMRHNQQYSKRKDK